MDYKSTTNIFKVASGHIFCSSDLDEYDLRCKKLLQGLYNVKDLDPLFKDYLDKFMKNQQYSWGDRN